MTAEPGLRERKKQQTRRRIAEAARKLFGERGFDRVTVAEVARAAEVAEATVFNYFATKEDLVYAGMETFSSGVLDAIRTRAPGESVTEAFGRAVSQPRGLVGAKEPEAARELATIMRMIADSPALVARERQTLDRFTDELAALIAEETGARSEDIEPWVVANALLGVHRALLAYVRGQVLAGRHGPGLARSVRAQAERSLAVLERGLAGYPFRRRPSPGSGARPRPNRAP